MALKNCGPAWEYHLPLFMTRQALSRQIYFDGLYRQLLDVPGVICEFGVQWGSTFCNFDQSSREFMSPIIIPDIFMDSDTFSGFASVDVKDGPDCEVGDYTVLPGYEKDLEKILACMRPIHPGTHQNPPCQRR